MAAKELVAQAAEGAVALAEKEPVTILWIARTADEWTAWSAVGTIGATLIALLALLLPMLSARRRRRAAKADTHATNRDVVWAVNAAIQLFDTATDRAAARKEFYRYAAIARYKSQSLRLLATKPTLSIGAIDCALGAAEMLELIVLADDQAKEEQSPSLRTMMGRAAVIAAARRIREAVDARLNDVAAYHNVDRYGGSAFSDSPIAEVDAEAQ